MEFMKVGKVSPDVMKKTIFDKLNSNDSKILVSSGIGEDSSILKLGDCLCAISTDPITGATNDIGRLSVHISCNDVAACGIRPFGLLVTILLPEFSTENDLEIIMNDIYETCDEIGVFVLGGHTEVTNSVNSAIISTTAIGISKYSEKKVIKTSGALPGDSIVVSKTLGLEGAAILAKDKSDLLIPAIGKQYVDEAKDFLSQISVIDEGLIGAKCGATSMHDVTEGGIFGAVWEISEASKTGFEIYEDNIPVSVPTKKICDFFNISPFKLISSGSMLITTPNPEKLIKALNDKNIQATKVGKIVADQNRRVVIRKDETIQIKQPESDELYKVV